MVVEMLAKDEEKSVEQARDQSFQDRATSPDLFGGIGLLWWLVRAGEIVSPWWSKQRDADLRTFWQKSDHISGAFYAINSKLTSVPVHVEPRDTTVKAHMRQAEEFTRLLVEESEYGHGWQTFFGKWLLDLWTSDNGAFAEVIGPGPPDGPLVGRATGLANLDSYRCQRTSSQEFPVVYDDTDGKRFKLHYTRVMEISQMPSAAVEMHNVGFCWLSRCINTAQNLIDISRYKQEKLGSRPLRAIMLARAINKGVTQSAMGQARAMMDQQNLSRFAKIPIIEGVASDAGIDIIDLASLPDGFDERTATDLGMFVIALTGSVPPRWLWPATVSGATKADAQFQHVAGLGGGAGQTLRAVMYLLGGSDKGRHHIAGKFLPPHLKLVFDFQDDEQDRMRANVKEVRAQTRERNLATGVINIRTAREQALSSGDISIAQFKQMELESGRTEDGTEVLSLFKSDDVAILALINVGVPEPLDLEANDPESMLTSIDEAIRAVREASWKAATRGAKDAAIQAMSALRELRFEYEQLIEVPEEEELEEEVLETAGEEIVEGEKERPF